MLQHQKKKKIVVGVRLEFVQVLVASRVALDFDFSALELSRFW